MHGNGAHAHWWAFIAPFLLEHYRVVALDLSGMGDSDHRAQYSPEGFAAEVVAVMDDAKFGADSIVVGHSFGGFVVLETGHYYGDRLGGIVLADFTVSPPDFTMGTGSAAFADPPKRVYNDFAEALSRFRLMPPQDCNNQSHSRLHRPPPYGRRKGLDLKFDDGLFGKMVFNDNMAAGLAKIGRRGAIYGRTATLGQRSPTTCSKCSTSRYRSLRSPKRSITCSISRLRSSRRCGRCLPSGVIEPLRAVPAVIFSET